MRRLPLALEVGAHWLALGPGSFLGPLSGSNRKASHASWREIVIFHSRFTASQMVGSGTYETTQYRDTVGLLRILGVATIGVHIIRSDATGPATEIDSNCKAATCHTRAGEATIPDSECGGAEAPSD